MPLLLLVPIIGAALWAGNSLGNVGSSVAADVTGTPQNTSTQAALPSWVIPTVVVGIGALLLYKEGAKLLRL